MRRIPVETGLIGKAWPIPRRSPWAQARWAEFEG